MASYDEYGTELQDRASSSANGYNPSMWDDASNALNHYNSQAGGGAINWEAAKSLYEKAASSGQGNHGDWVNQTWDQRNQWTAQPTSGYKPSAAQTQTTTQAWTRQNVADTLARYGAASTANLTKAVQENPWLGTMVGGGAIRDTQRGGTGETWDVIGNLKDPTQTMHWQTLTGHTAAAKAAAAGKGGGGAIAPIAAAGSGGPAAIAGTAQSNLASTLTSQQASDMELRKKLIDQLLGRAQQSLVQNPNSDGIIRKQADAYSANEERAKRNYLADIAEEYGPNANLRAETRLASEKMGQRTGAYEADLQSRELTARRAEIASALESLQGMIKTGQETSLVVQDQALRKELALMDDAIAKLKLKQDNSQFNADLAYRNSALSQQGQIANNQLGFNYSQLDWQTSPLNPNNYPS